MIYRFLPQLEVLNLTDNFHDTDIQSELQYCKNLTYLGLGSSLRSGVLPSELGLLAKLQVLDVSNNPYMSGTVPEEFGQLTNLNLFDISDSSISGTIPTSLCELATSGALNVAANCTEIRCCN